MCISLLNTETFLKEEKVVASNDCVKENTNVILLSMKTNLTLNILKSRGRSQTKLPRNIFNYMPINDIIERIFESSTQSVMSTLEKNRIITGSIFSITMAIVNSSTSSQLFSGTNVCRSTLIQ